MSIIKINPNKIKVKERKISYIEWRALFTEEELIWAFDSERPSTIRDMITLAVAENSVNLNSPGVENFLDFCIALGSPLTEDRKKQILSGTRPNVTNEESNGITNITS